MKGLYEEWCVAFIDILGFKSMTSTIQKIAEHAKDLTNSIDLMKSIPLIKQSYGTLSKDDIIIIQGSDSLIIIFPKTYRVAYNVIRRIMILQLFLGIKGIYLRGSINSGAMYIDTEKDIYFGEAWNKAVLEEATAINPRIILEYSIAELIEAGLREINESVGEFYLDDDGVYVLDSYGIWPEYDLKEIFTEPLPIFLDKLDFNIQNNKNNKTILQKYLWITNSIQKRQHGNTVNLAKQLTERITTIMKKI